MNRYEKWPETSPPLREKRYSDEAMPALMLVEIDPVDIVDGELHDDVYKTGDISTFGATRETCPECDGVHLQLVLRQKNVQVEHLLCPQCTRCFDACLPDGASAIKT